MLVSRLLTVAFATAIAVPLLSSAGLAQGSVGAPGGVSNSSPGNSEGSSAGGTGTLGTTATPGRIVLNPPMANSAPSGAMAPMHHRTHHHRHHHHH